LIASQMPMSFRQLTMRDIEGVIDTHRDAMTEHPLMRRLETGATMEQFRHLLPRLGFFVLAFQDVLRLVRTHSVAPDIIAISADAETGDRGHEQWYLGDLASLGIELDARWMFSAAHAVTRDTAYVLISCVLAARNDCSRLAVVLCLEALAREFFVRVAAIAKRLGVIDRLRYFSGQHVAAELDHDMYTEAGKQQVSQIVVPESAAEEVLSTVERTFAAMIALADDLSTVFD
jgi:hypothetical protein